MRREDRKGSALVITMLILVILTVAAVFAVGHSTSEIESASVAMRELEAANAAEAGLSYGIDRIPFPAKEHGIRLPNGARYDVTVSPSGMVPVPGYDMGWAQILFRVLAVGSTSNGSRIRSSAEAEVSYGPVRSGTGPAGWEAAPCATDSIPLGPPSPLYHDFRDPTARRAFVQSHAQRKCILLDGAGPRMLRVVDAGSWIPGDSGRGVESPPASEERGIAVADIRMSDNAGGGDDAADTGWRTIVVAGDGTGDGGLFSYDVTDPGFGGTPVLLWEITKRRMPILGRCRSAPAIGKVRVPEDRDGTSGMIVDRWVVLIGGDKGILVLEAATGRILQLLTSSGMGEIVASPAIAFDREGYIGRVYVGDLSGNLWRAVVNPEGSFDLGGGPFFSVTRDEIAKEIRGKCAVVPGEGEYQGLWVFFGTGNPGHLSENRTGGIFAVFDGTEKGGDGSGEVHGTTERDLTDETRFFERIEDPDARFVKPEGTTSRGWYAVLPTAGERILSGPRVFFSNLFIPTFRPGRKGGGEQGTRRIFGFGIAPGKDLGDAALFDLDGSGHMAIDGNRAMRVRAAGTGVMPARLVVSTGIGELADLSVQFQNGDFMKLHVPAPGWEKSVLGGKTSRKGRGRRIN